MNENEKPKRKTHTSSAVKRRYAKKVYRRVYAEFPKELANDFKESVIQNGTSIAAVFKAAAEKYLLENPVKR